ncbi:TD and POZ domain-containing protein 5-like [Parasteatoda tepidariorum]|uniref:TD and POZ domain-containing protein 5-like n=1 Tax=Parasteatoda tepidariorum TaxID=114398 RepID=UPI00077FA796
MASKIMYDFKWNIEDFTTRRNDRYSKQFWPFEGRVFVDRFGKVYNPCCIISYESEGNDSEREVTVFYLKFDGTIPEDLKVTYLAIRIQGIDECIFHSDSEKLYVKHGRVLLFRLFTQKGTLRVAHEVMKYKSRHDYIEIEFTFLMYFRDPVTPKRTITPAINIPRKRRCYLCSDFKHLYESKKMSDVTITVGGVSLLAHKLVLVTHSPVFTGMFDNDCLESNTKTIQITDVDASVFDNFLKCLYCSEIGDKSYDMVRNLYVLADKYAVDALKDDCRDILEAELNEGTVCPLLEMSYLFKDETLKGKAVEFIKQHFSAVSKKPEWLKICEDHPKIASDVLRMVTLFLDDMSKLK